VLSFLYNRAQRADSLEVPVQECVKVLSKVGSSEAQLIKCMGLLIKHGMIKTVTAESVNPDSTVTLSRCGGYYLHSLAGTFAYLEACLIDTAIEDSNTWQELAELTNQVEHSRDFAKRMELRYARIMLFLKYLIELEASVLADVAIKDQLLTLPRLAVLVENDAGRAVASARRYAVRTEVN
jgi:hypothetical protein